MILIELLETFIANIKEHGYKYAIDGISVSGNFMRSDPETLDSIEDKRDYFAK